MENPKKSKRLPIYLPSSGWQRPLIRALYSLTNFAKASILSLVVIIVILLLLTRMEQAFTMLLRMIENERGSLIICFLMVNLLAISLSHYPVYTYYAGNLNGSRGYILWKKEHPVKIPFLKWIWVYTFRFENAGKYVKDIYFDILRNYLGLVVFVVWILFIFSTFEVNLYYFIPNLLPFKIGLALFLAAPFITFAILKRKLSRRTGTLEQKHKIYRKLGVLFVITLILSITTFLIVLFSANLFSFYGLVLLLTTTFLMMFNYTFFRLVRPRLYHVIRSLNIQSTATARRFLQTVRLLGKSSNYLVIFQLAFYVCLIAIIYFNMASIYGWKLPNGLSIVLVYIYFYYFCISSIGKFYFVYFSIAQRQFPDKTDYSLDRRSFRYLTFGLSLFALLFIIGLNTESSLNELDKIVIKDHSDGITLKEYEAKMLNKNNDTVYFISSHGGGLKANSWTLRVIHELQKRSEGKFLEQSIAMSGASGGSLGLALYGDIMGNCNGDMDKIDSLIRVLENDNYASVDVSMVMGLDAIRSLFPFNRIKKSNDRSYYDMLKYQNHIHNTDSRILNYKAFRSYWRNIQSAKVKLPILIMNTASTSGRRGVFCSLNTSEFADIFPYAKDLSELQESKTKKTSISFYQAVSTTNRFPVFSPVAKIKGSGHYMDAGAIDNSGILGCLDVYLYFDQKKRFEGKKVVFVDIDNSKSAYAENLFLKFVNSHPEMIYTLDENEKSSIGANIQTGFSLNKIPGYLREFMIKYVKKQENVSFKQVFLPHKISICDIEDVIDAKIEEGDFLDSLNQFIAAHNQKVKLETESYPGFFGKWKFYDPVLCRQLSKSNIKYFARMQVSSLNGIGEVFR